MTSTVVQFTYTYTHDDMRSKCTWDQKKKKKKTLMHILSDICTCAWSVLETNKKEKKRRPFMRILSDILI